MDSTATRERFGKAVFDEEVFALAISEFVQSHVQTFNGRPRIIYKHADPPHPS